MGRSMLRPRNGSRTTEEGIMPRPRKWRRVCRLPQNTLFGPLAGIDDGTIVMTVEEYETIRLIDLEGLNQEACAERMHVARTCRRLIQPADGETPTITP